MINTIILIFFGILGGLPSLYVLIALPVVIAYKIYRRIVFGEAIM